MARPGVGGSKVVISHIRLLEEADGRNSANARCCPRLEAIEASRVP